MKKLLFFAVSAILAGASYCSSVSEKIVAKVTNSDTQIEQQQEQSLSNLKVNSSFVIPIISNFRAKVLQKTTTTVSEWNNKFKYHKKSVRCFCSFLFLLVLISFIQLITL